MSATRQQILRAAQSLFHQQGYHATSLREIAERVGITKAALYYHFDSKSVILSSLLEPMLEDLERVVERATRAGSLAEVRVAAVKGYLETLMRHRESVNTWVRESGVLVGSMDVIVRLRRRAIQVLAGPNADLDELVRATQVLAVLGDPLVVFADVPAEELTGRILAGAWRLLETDAASAAAIPAAAPPEPVTTERRRGGRPTVMSPQKIAVARELYATRRYSVEAIAELLGVSRATMYRQLRGAPRGRDDEHAFGPDGSLAPAEIQTAT